MALSLSRISSATELKSSCDFGLSPAKSSAHFLTCIHKVTLCHREQVRLLRYTKLTFLQKSVSKFNFVFELQ